jgi:hypothetical protein
MLIRPLICLLAMLGSISIASSDENHQVALSCFAYYLPLDLFSKQPQHQTRVRG